MAGGLVHDDVRLPARDRLHAPLEVGQLRHEIALGPARDEERGFLAEQLGGPLLQGVDGGIVAQDVVAHLGLGHRATHLGRRPGDGVAPQIDHGHAAEYSRDGPGAPLGRSARRTGWRDQDGGAIAGGAACSTASAAAETSASEARAAISPARVPMAVAVAAVAGGSTMARDGSTPAKVDWRRASAASAPPGSPDAASSFGYSVRITSSDEKIGADWRAVRRPGRRGTGP